MAAETNRISVTFAGWENLPYIAEFIDYLTSTQWINFASGVVTGQFFTVVDAEGRSHAGPEASPMRLYRIIFLRDY